jgi:D-beta-D-heptose 7-phosphate kinase / D-beta-D-heptose 1-phosphate adenosyltransferase
MDATELLSPKRVLVLGDMMLDRYTWGRAERVSPEVPVLILDEKRGRTSLIGKRIGDASF